tara:strand:- start:250 stop:546 length:297 start_codon:yes stop_codon:yes gene_type:complete
MVRKYVFKRDTVTYELTPEQVNIINDAHAELFVNEIYYGEAHLVPSSKRKMWNNLERNVNAGKDLTTAQRDWIEHVFDNFEDVDGTIKINGEIIARGK